MRLVGVSGSLRAASYNSALLRAAQESTPDGVELVEGSIRGVPLYDGDGIGILLRSLRVERHAAIGHCADAAEMLSHHEQRTLAVLDGVFWLGELGSGGQRHQRGGCCGGGKSEGFDWHGMHLVVGKGMAAATAGRPAPARSMARPRDAMAASARRAVGYSPTGARWAQ